MTEPAPVLPEPNHKPIAPEISACPEPAEGSIPLNYNPDVLSCLANLSNDEVFTPPALVNQILDTLPATLLKWTQKSRQKTN
ncbi:MAG: hypothetical protein RL497_1908 [Pseudomonadota bacterium]|jgi:hypothetical protein